MGEESTQLDLSSELDRLAAMKDDGDEEGGEGVRVRIGGSVIDPDGIEDHQLTGLTVEADDPELRGTRWNHPLHDLHRDGVAFEIDGESVTPDRAFDALGGPELATGYVLDRATGTVAAIDGVSDAGPDGDADANGAIDTGGATDTRETTDTDPRTATDTGDDRRVTLQTVTAPPAAEAAVGDTRSVTVAALTDESRPGFCDGDRYRTYDPLGRSLDPTTL